MQILQASESSGGGSPGNGGLYGVGFGSSTIIVLMAIAIYYLKRQIKQLQVTRTHTTKHIILCTCTTILFLQSKYISLMRVLSFQDQVELGERRRRKSRPSRAQAHEDDEEEADDL